MPEPHLADWALSLLDPALRRCLLLLEAFNVAQPPLDLDDDERLTSLTLEQSRHFPPDELIAIGQSEVRLQALTCWALQSLRAKPYIIQYSSPGIRWRGADLPVVGVHQDRPERVLVRWSWPVQFASPEQTENVYLARMPETGRQLSLF